MVGHRFVDHDAGRLFHNRRIDAVQLQRARMLARRESAQPQRLRICQGRPWIFADIRNAFEGSDARVRPTLGEVGAVVMRHARLLVEFFDGDERMAVHDLRKHIAWYLKGFPVGGSVRAAFMGCESLAEVQAIIDGLDQRAQLQWGFFDVPVSVASILRIHRIVSKQLLTLGVRGPPAFQPAVGKMDFFRKANTTASAVLRNGLKTVKHVTFIDPSAIE